MCTAISFLSGDHYFGRNLDLEFCYHEQVTITPRNYPLHFHNGQQSTNHPAIIGIATVAEELWTMIVSTIPDKMPRKGLSENLDKISRKAGFFAKRG